MIEKNVVFRIPLYIPNKCSGYLFELLIKISDKVIFFLYGRKGWDLQYKTYELSPLFWLAQITIPFAYWMSK